MTTYESMRHPGTFIHADEADIDQRAKTILYLDADGRNKSMSLATLKRWYKPLSEWPEPETEELQTETEEVKPEEPAKPKTTARKPKSLKVTEITYKGETKSLKEWAAELQIPYPTLYDRINRNGWSIEDAIRIPLGVSRNKFRVGA